jgi:hypothetical protein
MGGGVSTISVYGDHACIEQYTFEADTIAEIYAATSRTLTVSGWSLSISDSTADACPVSIGYADGVELMRFVSPLNSVSSGDRMKPWTVRGVRLTIPAGAGLAVIGGASGATLNGIVFVTEATA